MKNPCKEVKTAKRAWKVRRSICTLTVRAPNTQDRPNKDITPAMLSISLRAVEFLKDFFLRECLPLVCLSSTTVTMAQMTALKSIMRNIGPKNAAKNTIVLLRKQLKKKSALYETIEQNQFPHNMQACPLTIDCGPLLNHILHWDEWPNLTLKE